MRGTTSNVLGRLAGGAVVAIVVTVGATVVIPSPGRADPVGTRAPAAAAEDSPSRLSLPGGERPADGPTTRAPGGSDERNRPGPSSAVRGGSPSTVRTADDTGHRRAGPAADLRDYGAACDGTTDDRPALQAAVNDMVERGGGVVTVSGVCRIVQIASVTYTLISGPVTVRGVTDDAALRLDTDAPGAYRQLFKVTGDDVAFEDLDLIRTADVYGIMISLHGPADLVIDGVVVDGEKNRYSRSIFHGIAIWGDAGTLSNARILGSTIRNTDYGLFQPSEVTTTTDGFTVDRSTFTGNYMDDLEFNSPSGTMTGVTVTDSHFSANRAGDNGHTSGFGVGLANVQDVRIEGNRFDGYRYEPVHIEDRSANVIVHHNDFVDSFTAPLNFASHVFVVAGAHDITITANMFDTAANDNRVDCVYIGPGGGDPIRSVTVRDNTFKLRPNAAAVGNYGASDVEVSNNRHVALP